jgi:hypothetical protein
MEQSTKDDWDIIVPEAMKMAKALPDRALPSSSNSMTTQPLILSARPFR